MLSAEYITQNPQGSIGRKPLVQPALGGWDGRRLDPVDDLDRQRRVGHHDLHRGVHALPEDATAEDIPSLEGGAQGLGGLQTTLGVFLSRYRGGYGADMEK